MLWQVYIATGQLLCLGGLSVESSSILAIAEADVLSISPENKLKPKGTAAAVKNRLGLVNRKTLPSAPSSASLHSPSPDPSVTTRCIHEVPCIPFYGCLPSLLIPLPCTARPEVSSCPSAPCTRFCIVMIRKKGNWRLRCPKSPSPNQVFKGSKILFRVLLSLSSLGYFLTDLDLPGEAVSPLGQYLPYGNTYKRP